MVTGSKYFSSDEVELLVQRSDTRGFMLIGHCYGVIAVALLIFAIFPNLFTFVLTIMLIGSRQLGLAILMHDAAHGVLFERAKFNEIFGDWFCGSPILAELNSYRRYHLKHHKHTQMDEDPDLVLSSPFPITRLSLMRKFFRDLSGQTGVKLILIPRLKFLGKKIVNVGSTGAEKQAQSFKSPRLVRPMISNLFIFFSMWCFGEWWWWLVFWLVPLLTWFQVVVRVRNIAEHAGTEFSSDQLQNVRTTHTNFLTKLFVAPYWVNYHLEHHLMMYIPCWRLAAAHKLLLEKGCDPQLKLAKGYLAVLREVVV